ncbi:hypothetical protein HUJ04_007797 [Dendroctonus ponderosae]|nr:hypothetical protein HUJ04_007797 [Dendroctonus ponderosae]
MDNEYQEILPKVSGYLEKKGRKRMISCYKKYWFVLEGRLLLYYKSKDEYEKAISPCKGFISLGHTSNRADSKEEQHKWMHALMTALNQKNEFKRLNHFRYSTGDLSPPLNKALKSKMHNSPCPNEISGSVDSTLRIVQKLQKLGAKTYGISAKLQKPKTGLQRPISLSDEHIPSNSNKPRYRLQKSESVIVENEILRKEPRLRRACSIESPDSSIEQIYERIPNFSDAVFIKNDLPTENSDFQSKRTTLLSDNSIYWTRSDYQEISDCNEYGYEAIDFNDNIQPRIENQPETKQIPSEENIYVEADIKTSTSNSNLMKTRTEQMETLTGNQGFYEDKEKRRFCFNRKAKSLKEKPKKVKRSESFLHRVWSKKRKTKPIKKDLLSSINIAKKLSLTEAEAIKTLNQLHHLLKTSVEQLPNATQITESDEKTKPDPQNCAEPSKEHHGTSDSPPNTHQEPPINGPTLPPRNPKLPSVKEDTKLPSLPPKMKRTVEAVGCLDAILSDLSVQADNVQKPDKLDGDEGQCKVKELIKRFSIGKEEGVELRQKQRMSKYRPGEFSRDTPDLDKLLDELAKVTTAPIMTPGVTSSLINPEISQKEIQKMAQSRRPSDPDYDIPRPHRSLPNLPKKDDNALEATRFFGPILKPSDCRNARDSRPPTPLVDYHSNVPSITPDSLEVENRKTEPSQEDFRLLSFHSHDYLHFKKASHHNLQFSVEQHLYSDPRLLLKSADDFSVDSHDVYQLERSDCVFIDSLDP